MLATLATLATLLKYFKRLQPLFARLHDVGTDNDHAANRQLHFDHYASLILLYFFNPCITSLRAIQQASDLDKVQKKLGVPRTSLGSLSAAARVFDPEPLQAIIAELAAEALPLESGREAEVLRGLTAVDGSLLRALRKAQGFGGWRSNIATHTTRGDVGDLGDLGDLAPGIRQK
jgi:hypothetical protein